MTRGRRHQEILGTGGYWTLEELVARQERAERTRGRILDAAAAVFDERGFSGASLSDILARAGVTKGALYFHFSSKEELAKYLVEEQFSLQNLFGDKEDSGLQTARSEEHTSEL